MQANNKALLQASVAVLSWATVATAFKMAQRGLTFFGLTLVATLTALALFAIYVTIERNWRTIRKFHTHQWGYFAILGLINPTGYYLVLMKSYKLLPAQVAQPVNYIWPVALVFMLAMFLKIRIEKRKYIGMLVSLLGVIVISVGASNAGIGDYSQFGMGLILASFSAVLWAAYWKVNNQRSSQYNSSVQFFMGFMFGALYQLMIAFVLEVPIFKEGVSQQELTQGILWGIYAGLFEMGIPFICFGLALKNTTNPALVNQLCYLGPFLSLFFIAHIVGERILPATYVGLALIVAGIIYNQYFTRLKLHWHFRHNPRRRKFSTAK